MTKKWIILGGALIVALSAVTALVSRSPSPVGPSADGNDRRSSVRIAANLPMTGDLAIYGTAVREGASLAVEDLARSEPQTPKLKFDWQDNAGEPRTAVSIMQQQYLDPPDIYLSGLKPQTMAIMDQIVARHTPHFIWHLDAFINRAGQNNLRVYVSYKIEPPVYLEYARKRHPQRVAIVYVQVPNTIEEFNQLVIPGLKKQGAKAIFMEPFQIGKKDFKDVALKVANFKPDLIILNGFQPDLVALVRAFRPLNLITDGNTIATYDMLEAATVLGPDEVEGIRVVAPLFLFGPDRENIKQWRERFTATYHKPPLYTHAFAYDMALIIHDAAKRLTLPATSDQWIQALRATDIPGVTGQLRFDSDGDLITALQVGVYRGGKLVADTER
jgi:branched-chain amino acid transport system substrate-binding protein